MGQPDARDLTGSGYALTGGFWSLARAEPIPTVSEWGIAVLVLLFTIAATLIFSTRGAPVEVEKQNLERGTYQHPELYGLPPELGLHYDAGRTTQGPREPEGR